MKRLEASRTYSSPSRRAVVRIAAESEPEPDSVSAYAGSHSPEASFGRERSLCSSVPASLSPSEPSSCTARISAEVAQTFPTSSIATNERSVPVPSPPCSSPKKRPKMSFSRNSSTTSQGNSWEASISAARGAIRSRASCRTRSRSSRCSSLRTSQGTAGAVYPGGGACSGRRRLAFRSAARDAELRQEVLRALRVQPEIDVGRPAWTVAGDRDRRDRLSRAEEVRPARVAVAGTARADRRVLRQAEPAVLQRIEERGGVPAEAVEVERRLAVTHLLGAVAVADCGECRRLREGLVRLHRVEQANRRKVRGRDPLGSAVEQDHRDVVSILRV